MLDKLPPHPRNEMLDELHAIRAEISREIEGMTPEERIRWYNQASQEDAEARGCDLVPSEGERNVYKMVPRKVDPNK